jgi:hypothetical protein
MPSWLKTAKNILHRFVSKKQTKCILCYCLAKQIITLSKHRNITSPSDIQTRE